MSFIDTDPVMDFKNVFWPQYKFRISWINKIYRRNIVYDEKLIKEGRATFEKVEDLYRKLKSKSKKENNEPETSNWHYCEKEIFRKRNKWRRFLPSVSVLYWASSGYGERPVRASFMLLTLVVLLIIFVNANGLDKSKDITDIAFETIKGFSGNFDFDRLLHLIIACIQHILFIKNPSFMPFTTWGVYIMQFFTKFLIPIQAVFFAMALRNKFRR